MQWRMSGTSCRIIGNDNGGCVPTSGTLGEVVNGPGFGWTSDPDFNYLQFDNGNLNYRKNQLVSAALKGNHELALRFRDGWSALGRFSWLYDPAADNTERTPLSDGAKNISVHNITLLDLWVAKDFEIADRPGKVRVGNQVLSWGEDIFIYSGINIINPIDLTRVHKPGVQLKEVFGSRRGIYFGKAISYGNALDLDSPDLFEMFADDSKTKYIALYIEGVKDGQHLFRAAKKCLTNGKPLIILKVGSTEAARQAVTSHTGALAGSEQAWEAFFAQTGAIRVNTLEQMVEQLVALQFTLGFKDGG